MQTKDFTKEILHLIEDLKSDITDKEYSDVIDDKGNQYVDLVLEGGGVLGISLVGFTYVLEQVGIRFLQIGGTSAGAINAIMLAALGTPSEKKSEKIIMELANVNMFDFVDGDDDAKDFIDAWLNYGGSFFGNKSENNIKFFGLPSMLDKAKIAWQAAEVKDNIKNDLGLNPGVEFQLWVKGILKEAGIRKTSDLLDRLSQTPKSLKHREANKSVDHIKPKIALIAADVSTQTKAIFPQMAELYWDNPDDVDPSKYVRASMSIPGFFHPFRVENIPNDENDMLNWGKYGFKEVPPSTCVFVDGGIMSNFPINLFHRPDKIPSAPTFGVKLGDDVKKTADISTPFKLVGVIFDSARLNLDNDFITRNPDYKKLVSYIDTGDHNWINFNLSDADKIDLFRRGAEEAARFLRGFDWKEYKSIRGDIAKAVYKSKIPKDTMSGSAVPPID